MEAFFSGDRARVLREVANRSRSLNEGDAKPLAEFGHAYPAALDVQKSKEILSKADTQSAM